jgi:hypothetical protein
MRPLSINPELDEDSILDAPTPPRPFTTGGVGEGRGRVRREDTIVAERTSKAS